MKRLRYIRRAPEMTVENASIHGGIGKINMPAWTGSVIWGADEDGWEHVSVAPFNGIIPSWEDMCRLKDIFFEDEEAVIQIHPPKSQYVNMKENCLHLWRPKDKHLLDVLEGRK